MTFLVRRAWNNSIGKRLLVRKSCSDTLGKTLLVDHSWSHTLCNTLGALLFVRLDWRDTFAKTFKICVDASTMTMWIMCERRLEY